MNYRVVVIETMNHSYTRFLSLPVKRLENDFKEDLIRADMPIGRILKKHNIESRREIKSVYSEAQRPEIMEIFNVESHNAHKDLQYNS